MSIHRRIGERLDGVIGEGIPVYAVGGTLRDLVSGRAPRDLDLVANTDEETLSRLLPAGRWVGKGERSARTMVLSGERGRPKLQIGVYSGDLEEELARRDFSINAMALSVGDEEEERNAPDLIDPFGGQGDIRQRVLRKPVDKRDPFLEDPLRVMRLARFVSELGYGAEKGTLEAASSAIPGLRKATGERVREEVLKLFSGPSLGTLAGRLPLRFLRLLFDTVFVGPVSSDDGPEEREKRICLGLPGLSRVGRKDSLFRLWKFWIVFREPGFPSPPPFPLRVLPFSRRERTRLSRWSRLEAFLRSKNGKGSFTTADRSLILAIREDRFQEVVREVAKGMPPKERKEFREWVGRTVADLSRPWSEVGRTLERPGKRGKKD